MPKPSEFQKKLILVGGLVGVFAYAAFSGNSVGDQIKEGCQREFANQGEQYVNACAITLITRKMNEIQQQKMDRAYR